jgi:hypothetical protein
VLEVEGECTYYSPTDEMAMEKVRKPGGGGVQCLLEGGERGGVLEVEGECTYYSPTDDMAMEKVRKTGGVQCVLEGDRGGLRWRGSAPTTALLMTWP